MAGAKQWQLPCPHIDGADAERTMCSEVTENNADKWAAEDRTPRRQGSDSDGRIGDRHLSGLLEHYDGTLVVCNSCRRIMVLSDGDLDVVHSGDPWYSGRVGEWAIDIESMLEDDRDALRGLER